MHDHVPPLLLVEDEADDASFVRRALTRARIRNRLIVCATAEGARRELTRVRGGLPALAIVDIRLPGRESGLDFLSWLRRQPPPLGAMPAMIYSVSAQSEHAEEARALGAVTFLRKPVDERSLADAVQSLGFVIVTTAGAQLERVIQPR